MSIKRFAKWALSATSPELLARISGSRQRRHFKQVLNRAGATALASRFIAMQGLTVHSGPFCGMRYIAEAAGSVLVPKLVGCYELEIREAVESALSMPYDTIVNVGCAEGYYAVGCAIRLPRAKVFAFDTDPYARRLCRQLAALNEVGERVKVGAFCTRKVLAEPFKAVR